MRHRLMNDQNSARMNSKSGRVSSKLGHFSKTDIRFWQDRLFRETYRNNGRVCQTSHWSARIQHEGRRERFPLYTPNRAAAAAKVRDMRRSRSLFSPKILRQLQLSLPSPLPFDGVEFEPRQSMKYRSKFSVIDLIKLANDELRPSDLPAYMIFLLGVAAGLRRKEIDLLEWSAFRFKENAIRVEPTQFFHPKSQDSIAGFCVFTPLLRSQALSLSKCDSHR